MWHSQRSTLKASRQSEADLQGYCLVVWVCKRPAARATEAGVTPESLLCASAAALAQKARHHAAVQPRVYQGQVQVTGWQRAAAEPFLSLASALASGAAAAVPDGLVSPLLPRPPHPARPAAPRALLPMRVRVPQGKTPSVTVRLDGLVQSYNSLRSMFSAMPGFLYSDQHSSVYIPIQGTQDVRSQASCLWSQANPMRRVAGCCAASRRRVLAPHCPAGNAAPADPKSLRCL
jgi:hypothetical protein